MNNSLTSPKTNKQTNKLKTDVNRNIISQKVEMSYTETRSIS